MSGNFDGERFDHIARSDWQDDERSRLMAEQERLLRAGVSIESLVKLDAMGISAGVVSAAVEEFGLAVPAVPVDVQPPVDDVDPELTGNPDGVTAPEIPEAPDVSWALNDHDANTWRAGWRAGYEACLLDRGASS